MIPSGLLLIHEWHEIRNIHRAREVLMRGSGKPKWWPSMVWKEPNSREVIDMAMKMDTAEKRFGTKFLALYDAEMAALEGP